jgi:hypothetical protein
MKLYVNNHRDTEARGKWGSDPSRDNDGVGSDDARFHRGSDPIFLWPCVSVVIDVLVRR